MRIWGCKCVAYIPENKQQSKLHPRGKQGVFIGYVPNTNHQYQVYFPPNKIRIFDAARVIFNEGVKGSSVAEWSMSLNYNWPSVGDKDGLLRYKDLVGAHAQVIGVTAAC